MVTPGPVSEALLIEMLKQNLDHARHVENERMLFNSLFGALVGGALALSAQVAPVKSMVTPIILLLIIVNVLCLCLTLRWNRVFSSHWARARQVYIDLVGPGGLSAQQAAGDRGFMNRYFYFDNRPTTKL